MAADAEERTSQPAPDPVGRLTTMGLPPRTAGWVPEQPAEVGHPSPAPDELRSPGLGSSGGLAPLSRLDVTRLAVADWLPVPLGDRVRATSSAVLLAWVVAVVATGIAVGAVVRDHGHPSPSDDYAVTSPVTTADSPSSTSSTSNSGSSIVVDVGGRVRHPGLVTLPVGARVADAITAAGGALKASELARVDLAARVTDGELLLVGRKAGRGGASGSSNLVDLSTASLTKLETLPGVGPVTAQKIVDWRNAHGGFTAVAQLQQVPGIGPTRFAELSPLVAP